MNAHSGALQDCDKHTIKYSTLLTLSIEHVLVMVGVRYFDVSLLALFTLAACSTRQLFDVGPSRTTQRSDITYRLPAAIGMTIIGLALFLRIWLVFLG